jgi:hypothetical protein
MGSLTEQTKNWADWPSPLAFHLNKMSMVRADKENSDSCKNGGYDTQHKDTKHIGTQNNDLQHNSK